ncbi:MAG: Ribosomal protein S12 methylthiotransferase RimO [Elusimicrobia bacterium]|nr:Ribosomal protein S12 methylthiotransferase RimO [Elusimicrobiota bacterium]
MKKVSIITLGCAKNTNDTENLSGLLKKQGYEVEKDASLADAIVIHTCSFIEAAKKESIQTILDAAKLKGEKKKLYVTGCMVQQHGKEMMTELPEVDAFLGTGQLAQIPDLLKNPRQRFLDRTNPGGLTDPDAERELSNEGPTANLRLSEGCSHPCSFCVIPKLRGGLQSRPEEKILEEARQLVRRGIEEIVIIGQDTGDYGRDLTQEYRLPALLRKIRDIKGLRWVRLMYMHPHSFSKELMDVFSESPEIFPYLDMPLQHIDNNLLIDMKRKLEEGDLRRLLDNLHVRLPNLSLRTTFIVGYPGETDEQFTKLNDFVNEGHFNYMGAFTYSKEENTPAALKQNQIPEDIKQERLEALMSTQYNVAHFKAQKRLGSVETVIIEDEGEGSLWGRTPQEAPEIDAVVRLPHTAARKGRFIKAQLTHYDAYEYTAKPV